MSINPQKGDVVSFSLVNSSIYGGPRIGVTVVGVLDYEVAVELSPELNSIHNNLFPYFADKVNNVNDPAVYSYISVRLPNGQKDVIGIPWILDSSYQSASSRQQTYVINNFQEYMRATIEDMFTNLGCSWTGKDTTPQ